LILCPACSASSRHRCSNFSNALSSTASFFNGERSMPGAFHALAVDDGSGGTGFPLRLFATPLIKRVVEPCQNRRRWTRCRHVGRHAGRTIRCGRSTGACESCHLHPRRPTAAWPSSTILTVEWNRRWSAASDRFWRIRARARFQARHRHFSADNFCIWQRALPPWRPCHASQARNPIRRDRRASSSAPAIPAATE
jgi:hypothetical protein